MLSGSDSMWIRSVSTLTYGLTSKGTGGKGDTCGKGVWWTPPANNHRKHTLMVFMGLRGAKISPSFPAKTQQWWRLLLHWLPRRTNSSISLSALGSNWGSLLHYCWSDWWPKDLFGEVYYKYYIILLLLIGSSFQAFMWSHLGS